jgi:ribosomal protein S18 acetylase RimI-like enzyme
MEIRTAETSDAALISAHRRAMFAEIQTLDESVLDVVERRTVAWTERMIGEGKYCGWIATDAGRSVASAGLLILDWPPHPFDPEGELRGYLLNVYVDPEYRRRGLAHELVERSMAEARNPRGRTAQLASWTGDLRAPRFSRDERDDAYGAGLKSRPCAVLYSTSYASLCHCSGCGIRHANGRAPT